jgi:PKD repeat protein
MKMNQMRTTTLTSKFIKSLAAMALALGFLAVSSDVRAVTYSWTNTTGSVYGDPGAYTGGAAAPGGSADLANFTSLTGSVTVNINSNYIETGSLQFGSPLAPVTYTLNFGTNVFVGLNGNGTSASGFVLGQQGTATVYIAVGTMYCTNAAASPSNARLTIGRNNGANAYVYLTNGNVYAGTLVIANNAGASGCKLVISGPNSFWSNNNASSIGNVASANFNSLVVSNSASLCSIGVIQAGFQSPSHSNSVVVDTFGQIVAANGITLGAGAGSVGNAMTVKGGGSVDNKAKTFAIGSATSGTGNSLTVGNNGTVSNVTTLAIFSGNSLTLSGGVVSVSIAVTNNAGTVGGAGAIAGNVVFTGTGTLSPGIGSAVGTLTASNNLSLVSGSTTVLHLDKGQAGSNDVVNVLGTLTEGGTLTIINVGAPLVGGDTFKLFTLGTKFLDFAVTNLPPLAGTLVWDTSQLGSSGIISVVLPASIGDIAPQAVLTNTDVTISAVVTGVPVPVLQWQKGGVNVSDGATGNGSTISGSTSSSLTIFNSQIPDSGQYCLIASNVAGPVTNCMQLEVTDNCAAPLIGTMHDQNVISPNNATFTAVVAGIPTPTVQWQDNGVNITDATNTTLIIPGVTFALDGHQYCLIASNSCGSGTATNCALLHVVVPPLIQTQPVSLVVTQTQSATFSVVSTNGVPAPTYQWYFNNVAIPSATSSNYTIASAQVANAGTYKVTVANVVGSATSSNATLTVNSVMVASLTPSNSATAVCYDTPLYLAFDRVPVSTGTGKIQIFNAANTLVDTIDTSLGNLQGRTIGTETFNTFPVIITGSNVAVYPHLGVLSSNQSYYVTVDPGTFSETNGALFAGITSTNAWGFTTKSAPLTPNNLIVAADGSGDFCTVQGAVDSLPSGNTTYTLVNIRNGTYTEIVDTRTKNHITFRGQSRTGTVVKYTNNNNNNGSTHSRMSFKVFSDDIAIENLTLINTTPQGGSQAEALMIDNPSARFILNNAEVDSRQDTILANVNTSQGYFFNSLVQGNFDYVWGGGNCYYNQCEFRTIPTASSYNLVATRTDTGTGVGPSGPGHWAGWGVNQFTSNGFSFVHCRMTRSSSTVSNITMAGANGTANGQAAFLYCSMDVSNSNGYVAPTLASGVLSNELLWEFGNSNLDNTASASFGLVALTNGDDRLTCALDPTCWLNGWVPQLAPNIISGPTNLTVNVGQSASFTVVATGIPDPTYQWLKNGIPIGGADLATYTIGSAIGDNNGQYSVIVSNDAGTVTSSAATLVVLGTAPTASFIANPGTGAEPLTVTFNDTSAGSLPMSLFWDLGDGASVTNAAGSGFTHPYAAGTFTVTLVASNYYGVNTVSQPNLIVVVNAAFEAWQLSHFGCTNCAQALPSADPDGDGLNNAAEYLTGSDPNNSASALRITSATKQAADAVITWTTTGGHTNIVQVTAGNPSGSYSTNGFADIPASQTIIPGSGDVTTNYTDIGGGTNSPARYYRIRLVP